MNKAQRKILEEFQNKIEQLRSELQEQIDAEQEKFDNLPEGLQESTKGETITAAIDAMENANNSFGEVVDYLQEAIDAGN
jgi:hypothetical protein